MLFGRLKRNNSEMTEEIQLIWLNEPPKGKKVKFFVTDAEHQREIELPNECGEVIRQEMSTSTQLFSVRLPPNELSIDLRNYRVSILQTEDLKQSNVVETDLGYLLWRPFYK